MTNSDSDHDAPVTLRGATELHEWPAERAAAAAAAVTPKPAAADRSDAALLHPAGGSGDDLSLAVAGVAVVACTGWLIERRHRVAQRSRAPADVVAADAVPANASSFEPASDSALQSMPAPALQDGEAAAGTLAPMAQEQRQKRFGSGLGVSGQKRLIRILMWLRTVAGGAAILAAIAIVVFWSIETTDRRAGETGLNAPLLVLLLGGWAAFWLAGQVANMLHRAFFGRVHPKFDN